MNSDRAFLFLWLSAALLHFEVLFIYNLLIYSLL